MPTDSYPLSDLLYRSVALTDDSGDVTEAYDTDAYGNTIAYSAAGTGSDWWADDATTTDEPTCEFIFTGRRRDPESEIYFYRARYYSPRIGVFVGRDPKEYRDGMSLYEYAGSMPTAMADPFGTIRCMPITFDFGGPSKQDPVRQAKYEWVDAITPDNKRAKGHTLSKALPLSAKADCVCKPCGGKNQSELECTINVRAIIQLSESALKGKPVKFRGSRKSSVEGAYGHEQRHLRDYIKQVTDRVERAFTPQKVWCGCATQCETKRRGAQKSLDKVLGDWMKDYGGHAKQDQPKTGRMYPPLDGGMPPL